MTQLDLLPENNSIVQKSESFERNDFWLPEKVYEYLNISKDPELRDDIDEILLDYISSKHQPRTQIEYANDIRQFKIFLSLIDKYGWGDLPKDKSEYAHIVKVEKELYKNKANFELLMIKHPTAKKYLLFLENDLKLSADIIQRRLSVLNQFYQYLKDFAEQMVQENEKIIILKNPFKLIVTPKIQASHLKTSALTETEINKLIWVIVPRNQTDLEIQLKERDKLLILLHIHTGLRVSELLQTKPESFSLTFENAIIKFIAKGWEIRESLIELRLFNHIKAYCDRYFIWKKDYIFHPLSSNPLNNTKDKSISQVFYRTMLKEYWELAGITKHLKTHSIRATYITLLHLKGLNIQEIKDSVGHKDIQMTSHYIKSHLDSKKKSSRIMNGIVDY